MQNRTFSNLKGYSLVFQSCDAIWLSADFTLTYNSHLQDEEDNANLRGPGASRIYPICPQSQKERLCIILILSSSTLQMGHEAVVFQFLVQLILKCIVLDLRMKGYFVSKQSECNLKHFVTHGNEDGTLMLTTTF